jgi:hypothetical protein
MKGKQISPSEIRDDTNINTHGHRYSSSENEEEAEKILRTDHSIHSKIEALKAAVKKEIAEQESARRNTNRELSKTAEPSLSHTNGAHDIKQQAQNFYPKQEELHSEED